MCLITTAQPAANPRLLKEADSLTTAGFEVHAIGAHWADWASSFDEQLLANRNWTWTAIDWRRSRAPYLFWKTRLRHRAARAITETWPHTNGRVAIAAVNRVAPELARRAVEFPADLYIAHTLGALPAAVSAARRARAAVGFDAEDFHSGQLRPATQAAQITFTEGFERRYLARCDYVTAASPLIAEAYAAACGGFPPPCIRNVFPLAERPTAPRPGSSSGPLRLYWFSQTIGPGRGLEDVVRAMGRLGTGQSTLHLRGRWWPGFEHTLRQLAASVGIGTESITGLEPAPPDELATLAADYDIGLAVEPGDTINSDILQPNKFFLYLLAGLPIVGIRTRGQASLFDELPDASFGAVKGDVEALAAALRVLGLDRHRLAAARVAAWRHGGAEYNWDHEQHRFLAIVHDTLARRAGLA